MTIAKVSSEARRARFVCPGDPGGLAGLRVVKVLVADDDPLTAAIVERVLLSLGHEVEVVADGLAAWRAVRKRRHRVVVSDCMMPRLSGIELCRRIRNLPKHRSVRSPKR